MAKKITCAALFMIMYLHGQLNAQSFENTRQIFSFGFGFPNIFITIYDTYEIYSGFTSTGRGPYNLKYEYALNDNIGLGITGVYLSNENSWNYEKHAQAGNSGRLFSLLIRANYHFAGGEKLDPYIGLGLGYMFLNFEYFNSDPDYVDTGSGPPDYGSPLGYSGSIGARYYFTKNLGAYAEIGYDRLALMQMGLIVAF